MELITLTKENLEQEHICCAISSNKDCQVITKKNWLAKRFEEGLAFIKCNVRGKCFIEYIPAENAWAPINADGYMYINCFWVSGQLKGQGYSNLLLEKCIIDSKEKGKKGLVVLSATKKMPFLSDPSYLAYKGFLKVDTAPSNYVLYYLPFTEDAQKPSFRQQVKELKTKDQGYVLYYSDQCPFTAKYVPLLTEVAKKKGVDLKVIHIETTVQAQSAPAPFTSFSLFYNGKFITHEILSEKKFEKMIDDRLQ